MKPFSSVGKRERVRAIEMGMIRRVARKCKVTRATISRTFAGLVPDPNPKVVAAIRSDLERIKLFFDVKGKGCVPPKSGFTAPVKPVLRLDSTSTNAASAAQREVVGESRIA